MPIGPPSVVPAPLPLSFPTGLFATVTPVEVDDRFVNGVAFNPEGCDTSDIFGVCNGLPEILTVDIPDGTTGGTFTLSFNGIATAPIAYNATAAAVAAAVNAIPGVAPGAFAGTGAALPTGPVTLTSNNVFPLQGNIPSLTGDGTSLVSPGAVTIVTTQQGTSNESKSSPTTDIVDEFYQPFILVGIDKCSTYGFQMADYEARARRALLATESAAAALEFWAGAQIPTNRRLAQASATTIVPTVAGRRGALAAAVQGIANATGGATGRTGLGGYIHMRPHLAELLCSDKMLERQGNRLYTCTGVPVIADAGYPGTGPAGQAVTATSEWLFITDAIDIYRGEVRIFPSTLAENTDKLTNIVTYRAERPVAVIFNGCTHGAIDVNPAVV